MGDYELTSNDYQGITKLFNRRSLQKVAAGMLAKQKSGSTGSEDEERGIRTPESVEHDLFDDEVPEVRLPGLDIRVVQDGFSNR